MVGLMGKHVGEHGRPGRPRAEPSTRKFRDFAVGARGESVGEHAQTLCRALLVRAGGLPHCATPRVESSRTPEMWSVLSEPDEAAVMQMREDGRDGAMSLCLGQLCAPGFRVKVGENQLIHCVIYGVSLEQNVAHLGQE